MASKMPSGMRARARAAVPSDDDLADLLDEAGDDDFSALSIRAVPTCRVAAPPARLSVLDERDAVQVPNYRRLVLAWMTRATVTRLARSSQAPGPVTLASDKSCFYLFQSRQRQVGLAQTSGIGQPEDVTSWQSLHQPRLWKEVV